MSASDSPRIGLVAASSAVPPVEFQRGVEFLRALGLSVRVHEQTAEQHFHYAGTDERRAAALYEYAADSEIDVVWMARGGYGATRLLPLLDELTARQGVPPRKLLVGYSDVTVLHEFARSQWNWATLHAPMPASASFPQLKANELSPLLDFIDGRMPGVTPWPNPLKFIVNTPDTPINAPIVGGNLTLWQAMIGTPYAPHSAGAMLFFEEIGEPWYKVDRMVTHLLHAGAFDGVRAIILGDFADCVDDVLMGLASPTATEKVALRRRHSPEEAIFEIFGGVANRLGIPLATGLPVGHGPHFSPLPLGAEYMLSTEGKLELRRWDWIE